MVVVAGIDVSKATLDVSVAEGSVLRLRTARQAFAGCSGI